MGILEYICVHRWLRGRIDGTLSATRHRFEVYCLSISYPPADKIARHRAPKDREGLVPFCRDSFFAFTVFRLWKTSSRDRELLVEATSDTGVVEV